MIVTVTHESGAVTILNEGRQAVIVRINPWRMRLLLPGSRETWDVVSIATDFGAFATDEHGREHAAPLA